MGDIWFTSDTHFMGPKCLLRENRPFKSIYAFDCYVLKLWDSQVSEDDIIYHMGDFVEYSSVGNNIQSWREGIAYVQNIKCNVVLIIGNNEEGIIQDFFDGDFESFRSYCIHQGFNDVCKNKYLEIDDANCFYLVHKPSEHKDGVINLFGHVHRITGLYKPFGLNVNCDLNHFYLYDLMEIERLLKNKKEYWDNDKDINI